MKPACGWGDSVHHIMPAALDDVTTATSVNPYMPAGRAGKPKSPARRRPERTKPQSDDPCQRTAAMRYQLQACISVR